MVLTREAQDNEPLRLALAQKGIDVVCIPCVATRYLSPEYPTGDMDAVTFSSRRGVRGLHKSGLLRKLLDSSPKPLVGAVGQSTADELRKFGFEPDIEAHPPEGRVLAGMLLQRLKHGQRVLTVRGNLRAGSMDSILSGAGMKIVPLEVYENQDPELSPRQAFDVSAIFVASPSAGRRLLDANPWMRHCRFAVIGKTTQDELERLGVVNIRKVGAGMDAWLEALCQEHSDALKRAR